MIGEDLPILLGLPKRHSPKGFLELRTIFNTTFLAKPTLGTMEIIFKNVQRRYATTET